jgi:uncharacterized protein (TIGR00255 family)
MEPAFRKAIGQHLKRGKIDGQLRLRWSSEVAGAIVLDETALDHLANAIQKVAERIPESGSVNPLDALRWPGVVDSEDRDTTEVATAALKLLEETIQDLRHARAGEGARLRTMILERCDGLESLVTEARQRLPEIRDGVRKKLRARLEQLELDPDADRLEQEMVFLAQKMDVDEELDRLDSHISEARAVVNRDEAVGRRLDFLMQEFNREANTLASKSQDQETTRIGVEMKVFIEQMREQVQNIE